MIDHLRAGRRGHHEGRRPIAGDHVDPPAADQPQRRPLLGWMCARVACDENCYTTDAYLSLKEVAGGRGVPLGSFGGAAGDHGHGVRFMDVDRRLKSPDDTGTSTRGHPCPSLGQARPMHYKLSSTNTLRCFTMPGTGCAATIVGRLTALDRSRGHARCGSRNRTPICARCSAGEPANRHGFPRYRLAHISGSGPHSRPIPGELAGSPKAGVAGVIFDTP